MHAEYEFVPHTADLKIRAYGTSYEELFRNALRGMFASMHPLGSSIRYHEDKPIITKFSTEHAVTIRALDKESLLIDFLSECLYLSDTHDEVYFDVQFKELTDTEIDALVYGISITGYQGVEVKAVTYHDLSIESIDGLLVATIVFDI